MALTRAEISRRYRERHPERIAAQRAASADKQREHGRRHLLQKRYGLSVDQYDEMLADQDSRCAICRTDHPGQRTWHVDHCHATGVVRGLLCGTCNRGLGMFGDDPDTLGAAVRYLVATS